MLNDDDFDSDDDEVNADLFGDPSRDSRLYLVYSAQLYLHSMFPLSILCLTANL